MKKSEWAPGVLERFRESYDYTTCMRTDGSLYGTGGTCRKGTETTKPEKETSSKAKSGGSASGGTLSGGANVEKFRGTETVARLTEKNAELKAREKDDPDLAGPIKSQIAKNDKIINKYKTNSQVLDNITQNVPEGTKVSITDKGAVQMDYETKSGQKIKVVFGNKDYNFQVNGGYDAGSVTSRPQQIEVANAVRRNYEAVTKSLPQNAVIGTAAWTEDGRGASRSRAYERMGFSKPAGGPGGNQYARKEGSKMVPSNQSEEGLDQTYNFEEKSSMTTLWLLAIFGKS